MIEDPPSTPFEEAIARGMKQEESLADVLGKFWLESFVVPTGKDVLQEPTQFQPVLFPRESDKMMAVFTEFSRIPPGISKQAGFAVQLTGRDLLRGLQPGVGLVINPGSRLGFEILPSSVASIIKKFG